MDKSNLRHTAKITAECDEDQCNLAGLFEAWGRDGYTLNGVTVPPDPELEARSKQDGEVLGRWQDFMVLIAPDLPRS